MIKISRELIIFIVSAIIIVGVISTWPYFASQRQQEIITTQIKLNNTAIKILNGINDIKLLLNNTVPN